MSRAGGIRAGRAFVEIGGRDMLSGLLRRIQAKLMAWGQSLRQVGVASLGAGTAMVGAMIGTSRAFASAGDSLLDMSKRTGLGVETLSELKYAAELSGTSLEDLEVSFRKAQRTIVDAAEGSAAAAQELAAIGLSAAKLQSLRPDDQFAVLADRVAAIVDPTRRAAAAVAVFGRSGTQLLPMLEGGAGGLERVRARARALGLTMSRESAEQADQLADAMDEVRLTARGLANAIGGAVAPEIRNAANWLTRLLVNLREWVSQNRKTFVTILAVGAGLVALGVALYAVGTALSILGAAVGALVMAWTMIVSIVAKAGAVLAALASPIGLVIAAVVALGGYLLLWTEAGGKALSWLSERFQELKAFVGAVVGGIRDALAAGDIVLAGKILWAGLRVAWEAGKIELTNIWNALWSGLLKALLWIGEQFWTVIANVAHAIVVVWIESIAFIKTSLSNLGAWAGRHFEDLTGGIADAFLWLQGQIDGSFDWKAAQEANRKSTAANQANIDAVRDAENQRTEAQRRSARSRETAAFQDDLKRISDDVDATLAQIEGGKSANTPGTDELDRLKAELATLLKEAATKAAAAAADGPASARFPGMPQLRSALESASARVSVASSFNPDVLARQGGGDAAASTAKNTGELVRVANRIVATLTNNPFVGVWQ